MFANVIKKKNHHKINVYSLIVSNIEQSVLGSKVQSRRASQEVYYYCMRAEVENASGGQGVASMGYSEKLIVQLFPRSLLAADP